MMLQTRKKKRKKPINYVVIFNGCVIMYKQVSRGKESVMTRQEFISELRIALQGQVDPATIRDNVDYYETYIMQESRKGRTEEEVLAELGNPRLIAKTIISTEETKSTKSDTRRSNYNDYEERQEKPKFGFNINGKNYGGVRGKIMAITAIIAVVVVILGIIALFVGAISLLAPFIVPILIILLAVRLISRR